MHSLHTVPGHVEWMKTTELGFTQPRSSELKLVDAAILRYQNERGSQASVAALQQAWNGWKRTKKDWHTSQRNKGGIMDRLDAALREMAGPGKGFSKREEEALREMDRARRTAFQRLFLGKKVRLKGRDTAMEARTAVQSLGKAAYDISGVVKPKVGGASHQVAQALDSMIGQFFDESSGQVVRHVLMETFGSDVVAAMIPVVGHITGAASVLVSWGKVGKAKYDEVTLKQRAFHIGGAGTDAEAAFKGLERLLDSAITSAAITAATKTTAFTAKSLLVLADGGAISGPVVGAAEAVAKVTQKLYEVGAEYKETKRANALLRDPANLDFRLVEVYPLLGCYMLTCTELSSVINMARVEFGGNLWMNDVEWIKKTHIDPIRSKARSFMDKSLFHVPGVTPMVGSGTFDHLGRLKQIVAG